MSGRGNKKQSINKNEFEKGVKDQKSLDIKV